MKKVLAILLALSLALLVGCTGKGNYDFTEDNFPKIGALSSMKNLAQKIAMAATGAEIQNESALADFPDSAYDAYKALCDGELELLIAYEPDAATLKMLKENECDIEMTEIALDAVVFLTSFENPVDSLTKNQISGIYSGRIKTWDEVDGEENTILPYQNVKRSEIFDRTVNKSGKLDEATMDMIVSSTGDVFGTISEYKNSENAIGYASYSDVRLIVNGLSNNLTVKALSVDGVSPNAETVKSGEYPLTEGIYAVIRSDAKADSPERILYNWLLSEQGKEAADKYWY